MENIYAYGAQAVRSLRAQGMTRTEASAKVSAVMEASADYDSARKALMAL